MRVLLMMSGLVLALTAGVPRLASGQGHRVDDVAWLAGCWELARGTIVTVERWGSPQGGTMLGTSQTIRGGATVQYEFLRLFERDGALVYEAYPSGQATNQFTTGTVTDSTVTFSDPEHDFPQFITYVRLPPDSLEARIGGTRNGQERTVGFPYRRISCEDDR